MTGVTIAKFIQWQDCIEEVIQVTPHLIQSEGKLSVGGAASSGICYPFA
jgi:hypothetical protein